VFIGETVVSRPLFESSETGLWFSPRWQAQRSKRRDGTRTRGVVNDIGGYPGEALKAHEGIGSGSGCNRLARSTDSLLEQRPGGGERHPATNRYTVAMCAWYVGLLPNRQSPANRE
jgi:hypothetical protein